MNQAREVSCGTSRAAGSTSPHHGPPPSDVEVHGGSREALPHLFVSCEFKMCPVSHPLSGSSGVSW